MTYDHLPTFTSLNIPPLKPGEAQWLEIPCVDPARAIAFYGAVFGWERTTDLPCPMEPHVEQLEVIYPFVAKGGGLRGHFAKVDAGDISVAGEGYRRNVPVINIVVKDIDDTTKRVEAAGGKLHVGKSTPYDGRYGHIARYIDTEGNVVAAWHPPTL